MRASQLIQERKELRRMLDFMPSPILRPHLEAAVRDIDAALAKVGVKS